MSGKTQSANFSTRNGQLFKLPISNKVVKYHLKLSLTVDAVSITKLNMQYPLISLKTVSFEAKSSVNDPK